MQASSQLVGLVLGSLNSRAPICVLFSELVYDFTRECVAIGGFIGIVIWLRVWRIFLPFRRVSYYCLRFRQPAGGHLAPVFTSLMLPRSIC